MATLQNMIDSLRNIAQDRAADKVVTGETIGSDDQMKIDGTNVNFILSQPIVIEGSIYVTITGASAPQNTFRNNTIAALTDPNSGVITLRAPDGNPIGSGATVKAAYNYIYMSDDEMGEFLSEATSNLMLNAPADPTSVPVGLVPALMQYALANFFRARYAQFASKYSSSGGESGQNVEVVGKVYMDAAMKCEKLADIKRDAFYSKQGQKLTPAYAGTNSQGSKIAAAIDPITPIR